MGSGVPGSADSPQGVRQGNVQRPPAQVEGQHEGRLARQQPLEQQGMLAGGMVEADLALAQHRLAAAPGQQGPRPGQHAGRVRLLHVHRPLRMVCAQGQPGLGPGVEAGVHRIAPPGHGGAAAVAPLKRGQKALP
jgi:hypothetical protein